MITPRSVRFHQNVLSRLDRYVREHPGTSSSSVANMFVDEALRVHEHPGITFRPGPTGRRAALSAGPDIWEVIGALDAIREDDADLGGDALLKALTVVTGLDVAAAKVALRYYAEYPDEIDARTAANREAGEREERLAGSQQNLLRGHR